MFVQLDKKDFAHSLIVNYPRTSIDPWLIATELSVVKLINVQQKFLRNGREIVKSNRFEPENVTKLRSVIGTFFFYKNELGLTRKNVKQSLILSIDNSVARHTGSVSTISKYRLLVQISM